MKLSFQFFYRRLNFELIKKLSEMILRFFFKICYYDSSVAIYNYRVKSSDSAESELQNIWNLRVFQKENFVYDREFDFEIE